VNSDTAKVILLTDSNFEMSGIIQESRASGLIKGQIGSGLTMETISKDKEVKTGNMVVTSNLEPEIPEGLLIGRVTEIGTESGGLFQKASITPLANLDDIRNVVLVFR
jgi:rod shape-determining protein MreC